VPSQIMAPAPDSGQGGVARPAPRKCSSGAFEEQVLKHAWEGLSAMDHVGSIAIGTEMAR
jgi:hypothetical protein